ncbi:Ioc2p Ecym_4292 [Eremothecium cymbalariae DBVPG|uniref:Uncharacterized protein n=1 Tax=Eremothecium cymbalariae (strain CBS 270.75 / DBVPG 7215 / KCTC 17166 / NRRL Y-17582) TaxID=931890 RepID=G8JTK2_ERECY|nr:hypothetical protein Ecym_4292 [Eremothecium cymbalariae DBVPG\
MGTIKKEVKQARVVDWEKYAGDDIVGQLRKQSIVEVDPPESLKRQWYYNYGVGWLYNVCWSYWTADVGKAMWKEVRFEEKLLLADMNEVGPLVNGEEEGNLYYQVLLQLLRTVSQNKQAVFEDWDVTMKYHLQEETGLEFYSGDVRFLELSAAEQFEVIYRLIKLIERKSVVFRNYLLNNEHLFKFPQIWMDEFTSLFVLPGGKIIKKQIRVPKDSELKIPIKLRNCTVRYEDDDGKSLEVVHYDYSQEIDSYLQDVKVNYMVESYNWKTFLDYIGSYEEGEFREFFCSLISYAAANELYGAKLWNSRIKERSMQELITRRKRSSRLVAREEETQRKQLEKTWNDKLDERSKFIRFRHKLVVKRSKKIKDALWSLLWDKFEYDSKFEKIRRRTADSVPNGETLLPESSATTDLLSAAEAYVLEHGATYLSKIITIDNAENPLIMQTEELPDELCITKSDLTKLANHGIPVDSFQEDNKDWYFQCVCNIESGVNIDPESKIFSGYNLVCCDSCLRWQHWECQDKAVVDILSRGHDKPLTAKDFSLVPMGPTHQQRRTSRRAAAGGEVEQDTERPTMRRKFPGESEVFICGWCIAKLEQDIRSVFKSELISTRAKQKKQAEDRERRKKLKEEKKRQEELQKKQQMAAVMMKQGSIPLPLSSVNSDSTFERTISSGAAPSASIYTQNGQTPPQKQQLQLQQQQKQKLKLKLQQPISLLPQQQQPRQPQLASWQIQRPLQQSTYPRLMNPLQNMISSHTPERETVIQDNQKHPHQPQLQLKKPRLQEPHLQEPHVQQQPSQPQPQSFLPNQQPQSSQNVVSSPNLNNDSRPTHSSASTTSIASGGTTCSTDTYL